MFLRGGGARAGGLGRKSLVGALVSPSASPWAFFGASSHPAAGPRFGGEGAPQTSAALCRSGLILSLALAAIRAGAKTTDALRQQAKSCVETLCSLGGPELGGPAGDVLDKFQVPTDLRAPPRSSYPSTAIAMAAMSRGANGPMPPLWRSAFAALVEGICDAFDGHVAPGAFATDRVAARRQFLRQVIAGPPFFFPGPGSIAGPVSASVCFRQEISEAAFVVANQHVTSFRSFGAAPLRERCFFY